MKCAAARSLSEHSARVAATTAIHDEILAEVPVSNLVTPEWHVGRSARMDSYQPYGADYYIIHPALFVTEPETEIEGAAISDDDGDDDEEKEGPPMMIIIIIIAAAVLGGAAVFFMMKGSKKNVVYAEATPVERQGDKK